MMCLKTNITCREIIENAVVHLKERKIKTLLIKAQQLTAFIHFILWMNIAKINTEYAHIQAIQD